MTRSVLMMVALLGLAAPGLEAAAVGGHQAWFSSFSSRTPPLPSDLKQQLTVQAPQVFNIVAQVNATSKDAYLQAMALNFTLTDAQNTLDVLMNQNGNASLYQPLVEGLIGDIQSTLNLILRGDVNKNPASTPGVADIVPSGYAILGNSADLSTIPSWMAPTIADTSAANFYYTSAMSYLRKTLIPINAAQFLTGPAGVAYFSGGIAQGENLLYLAQGICHPQSQLSIIEKASAVSSFFTRIIAQADVIINVNGKIGANDFGISPHHLHAYHLFKATYPHLIPKSRMNFFETALKIDLQLMKTNNAEVNNFRSTDTLGLWVNADIRFAQYLVVAGLVWNDTEAMSLGVNGTINAAKSLLPDGGLDYIYDQNEVYTYHVPNVDAFARIASMPSPVKNLAMNVIKKTKWYIPLSVDNGIAEYSMASSWKHYWNKVTGINGALIVAGSTGDGHNQRIALYQPGSNYTKKATSYGNGDLWLASFFNASIPTLPSPENYFVYDKNIMGVRGRFGTFSFSGTSRPFKYYTNYNQQRGKSTYVGCIVQYPNGTIPASLADWPLNAALDSAGIAVIADVRNLNASILDYLGPKALNLAGNEQPTAIVTNHVASIATTFQAHTYGGALKPWLGMEQWIFTSQRLVGFVRASSNATQTAYNMAAYMKFVSGRGSWGIRQIFTQNPTPAGTKASYSYGLLNAIVHDHDYADIVIDYGPTMTTDAPTENKAGRLIFLDDKYLAAGKNGTVPVSYNTSDSHFYLVEVYPTNVSMPASSVARSFDTATGTYHLDLVEKAGVSCFRIVHNPTSVAQTVSVNLSSWNIASLKSVKINNVGATFRPSWISDSGKDESTPAAPQTASVNNNIVVVTVDANSHVLIEL